VERVVSQGHFVLTGGEQIRAPRSKSASSIRRPKLGTDALMMALWAHGIGKGDEVITTPVSFVATTGAIVHVGAKPVYVDVRDDQNIDPGKIEAAITPHTKAIMPVHWTGRIADMNAIMDIARKRKLLVIEDAAQTMGAYYHKKHGGSFGQAAGFSAHPLKNLNALGDGGLLGTNDDEVARKVRLYRTHGLESRDSCAMYGVNSRLDSLNAEVLKFRLARLKSIVDRRRRNVELYRKLIKSGPIQVPDEKLYEHNSYVMFITQANDRDRLKEYLAQHGINRSCARRLHLHKAAAKFATSAATSWR
jgi:dTDP-4-amino-4,6-dideoxygalactose transaminase